MATRLRVVLIAVVAVLAAYTGAAWLIGINVQSRLESGEQDALSNARYLVLIKREYHRGVFAATEQSTYGLKLPVARPGAIGTSAAPSGSALQLTVRNTIYHGPLPRLRAVALATVDSEVVFPPALAQKLDAILGGHPILTIRTTLGWLGGSTTDFSMPMFQAALPAGTHVTFRGMSGSATRTRNADSWIATVLFGGLDAQGPEGSVNLGELSFDANMRRAFDAIYVGDGTVQLASAAVRIANSAPVLMKGLSFSSASQAGGEYVNYQTRFAADQLSVQGFSFSHVVYGMRLLHLEGQSLAALSQAVRQAQGSAGGAGAAAAQARIRDALTQYGVDLLVHDPVIQIQSLAFALPEGEFHLAASLSAHGVQRADLMGGPVGMIALARYVDGALDLRIDDALLTRLLASTPRGSAISAQLDSWKSQGYLRRDGMAWTTQIAYHAGKLTINGQPYSPVAGF
jgi:uncharacterized protein YdgA (DUF945 family)